MNAVYVPDIIFIFDYIQDEGDDVKYETQEMFAAHVAKERKKYEAAPMEKFIASRFPGIFNRVVGFLG